MLLIQPVKHYTVKPHSLLHTCCYRMYICVTACFILEFSHVSRSAPLSPNRMTSCGNRHETVAVSSLTTEVICDYRQQNILLLKGSTTNSVHANAQGIWFPLMPVLHCSSVPTLFQTDLFEISDRKPCEVTFFP